MHSASTSQVIIVSAKVFGATLQYLVLLGATLQYFNAFLFSFQTVSKCARKNEQKKWETKKKISS